MDSPLGRPPVDRAQLSEDDDRDMISGRPLLFQWVLSIRPRYRALLVVISSTIFSALLCSSLPLWRPFGVLMLHKLWDILSFVVLTTSIGLGIANINTWGGNDKDRDAVGNISESGGKEDSVSSKVPFVSMFYSEWQPSDSFSDKEMEVGEYGGTRRSEAENGKGDGATTSTFTAGDDDGRVKYANIDKVANEMISQTVQHKSKGSSTVARDHDQSDSKDVDEADGRHVEEAASMSSVPCVSKTLNVAPPTKGKNVAPPTKGKSRLVKASTADDIMGLGDGDHGNEQLVGKVRHRRGNSLEFPLEQEERTRHKLGDGHGGPARDLQRRGEHVQGAAMAAGDGTTPPSTRKAPSVATKHTSDHSNGQSDAYPSSKPNIQSVSAYSSATPSKHSRSRSAYDINDLLVYERRRPVAAVKSKPVATASQLARRRKVSLSCDLDKDYSTVGGVPAWLASMPPPPPPPPPIDGYPGGAHRDILWGECVDEKKQDDSSDLRKAYTESLAPWRVATSAVPVSVPRKEASADSSQKQHPARSEEKKQVPWEENTKVLSPPSPNSFMGSPSPRELKTKVDDFIARFHERMRLQRMESLERARQAKA